MTLIQHPNRRHADGGPRQKNASAAQGHVARSAAPRVAESHGNAPTTTEPADTASHGTAALGAAKHGSAPTYLPRYDDRLSVKDAATIGPVLASLQWDPQAVVAAARDEGSPLHKYFLWDDIRAAHAYRLDQARRLIRSVVVEVEDVQVRAVYHVPDSDRSYVPIAEIIATPEYVDATLKVFRSRLRSLHAEYSAVRSLTGMEDVDRVLAAIDTVLSPDHSAPQRKAPQGVAAQSTAPHGAAPHSTATISDIALTIRPA